ncbi:MAG: hypothetical protein ACYS26_20960 [Planctomycetota bacterium]|jgi:hypothetical protein
MSLYESSRRTAPRYRSNGCTRAQRKRARFAQRYLVLGLAMFVAGRHAVLVTTEDLTPWKGGGFGMFSTIDAGASRILRVELTDEKGGRWKATVPSDLAPAKSLIRRLPSEKLMGDLVAELGRRVWLPPSYRSKDSRIASGDLLNVMDTIQEAGNDAQLLEAQLEKGVPDLAPEAAESMIPMARAWGKGKGVPRRVLRVSEVKLTVLRENYDQETGRLTLEELRSATAPGMGHEGIKAQLGEFGGLVRID